MRVANILVCHSYNPEKLFESIPVDDNPWFVFLHGTDINIELSVRAQMSRRQGRLLDYKTNRGLARSWNEGIEYGLDAGCDGFFLLNDDLFFLDKCYSNSLNQISILNNSMRRLGFVSLLGLESGNSENSGKIVSQGFSCCFLTRLAIEEIGFFDENFTPAYFEDCDYIRRIKLAQIEMAEISECMVEHERSGTIGKLTEDQKQSFWNNFFANKEYFRRKWGGYNDQEVYHKPFDAGFSLKISRSERHVPYPARWQRDGQGT